MTLADQAELPQLAAPQLMASGDFEALLAACFANPEDDLARLVLADYLEERGDDDWAKLIRVQMEREEPSPSGKKVRVRKQVPDEEARQINVMLEPVPESERNFYNGRYFTRGSFRVARGFLHYEVPASEMVTPSLWSASLVETFRQGRVESVTFQDSFRTLTAEAAELLKSVGMIHLSGYSCRVAALRVLATELAPGLPGSRVQRVEVPAEFRERWEELLAQPAGVQRLSGNAAEFDDPPPASLSRQVAAHAFRGATSGHIRGRLTSEVAGILASDRDLMAATNWNFRELAMSAEAAALLSADGARQTRFEFTGVGWGAGAVQTWFGSDWLRGAASISVGAIPPFGNADVALINRGRYPVLTRLAISAPRLGAGTARQLLTSGCFPALTELAISGESLDAHDALRLRLDPRLQAVSRMTLGECDYRLQTRNGTRGLSLGIGPDLGVAWPAGSEALDWSRVREVRIEQAIASPEWFALLVACFPEGLDSLILTNCGWRVAHAKALAAVLPTLKPRTLSIIDGALGPVSVRELSDCLGSVEELTLSDNGSSDKMLTMLPASCRVRFI